MMKTDYHFNFRPLKKDEIDCRLQSTTGNKARVLLYKDARVDMNILDEQIGQANWQRRHEEIKGNLFCGVGIRLPDGEWVWKWDCGTESNTEKEKGEASDAFKRACFNWGIGRELYTAPTISIPLTDKDMFNGKVCQSFSVADVDINSRHEITYLSISDKWGNIRYSYGKKKPLINENQKEKAIQRLLNGEDVWSQLKDWFSFDEEDLRQEVQARSSANS